MKLGDRVTIDDMLSISWGRLTPTQQHHIQETFDHLSLLSPEQWPTGEVYRLKPTEPLYVLRVLDPEGLRIAFFREEDGRIDIQSMAHQKFIDRYFSR